jgi:hypothetical protein
MSSHNEQALNETYAIRQLADDARRIAGDDFKVYEAARKVIEEDVMIRVGGREYYAVCQPSGHPPFKSGSSIYIELYLEEA